MVEGAPYEELTASLDALAAMPGADRTEIAGRRLALLSVCQRDEDERDRALREVTPDLATLPLHERVQWVLGACVGHVSLAERYLPPLIDELDATGDTEQAARARDSLDFQRSREEPRRQRREPEESGRRFPSRIETGIEVVRWLTVGRRTYREKVEALDAIEELPDSEIAAPRVASERLMALYLDGQDDTEAERVLAQVTPTLAQLTIRDRASAIANACSGRPALAAKHMPGLIAELQNELRLRPDEVGEKILASVRRNFEHTMKSAP